MPARAIARTGLHLRRVEPTTGRRDVKLYPPIDDAARSGTGRRAQILCQRLVY